MKKITNEEHLKFFDFILPLLSEKYPHGESIYKLASSYRKKKEINFTHDDAKYFFESYKNEYFTPEKYITNVIITTEAKEIIDTHGSLSIFQQTVNQEKTKAKKRITLTTISPILIAFALLITNIIFGVRNNALIDKVDKLEKIIVNKDSIIFELNYQLEKSDTLKIKALEPDNG